MLPSAQQNSTPMLRFFPLLPIPNGPVPIILPSALTNALPNFTIRTSGHYLGNFKAVIFLFPSVIIIIIIIIMVNFAF